MASEIFLDTAYALALSSVKDQFHARAVAVAQQLKTGSASLVTTRSVLLEIGDSLAKLRYRPAALQLLRSLEVDPRVEIVPISDDLYFRGLQLFRDRPDKEWGLTDCISFVVMNDRGITEALTTDEHFQQAGFRALLREESASSTSA